jgi:hypothetical protein
MDLKIVIFKDNLPRIFKINIMYEWIYMP